MTNAQKMNKYLGPLMVSFFFTLVLILWQIIWSFSPRNLPISFDVSLLQELSVKGNLADDVAKALSRRYGYDVKTSGSIKPDRDLPNIMDSKCGSPTSGIKHELPSPSIVVTFSNVDPSVLLRNVVSILTKSKPVALREIILVDDGSSNVESVKLLSQVPGIKILRNKETKGRGFARVQGAAAASGDVIVFVDSLAEVNTNWLYPLLLRTMQSPKSLVSPVLDSIDHVTFQYKPLPGFFRGGFDWSLQYRWEEVPPSYHADLDPVAPIRTPSLCGSVFAVRKDFFNWLGAYDTNPSARDTEDMELSLRAWLCGGQVEIMPCSRVGIVQVNGRELGVQATLFNNYLRSARRIAEVWLDEFKRYFYAVRPSARMQAFSDISGQRKLKEKLKCKSFKWFLTSVYPQLQPLIYDEVAYGSLKQRDMCVDLDPGQLPLVAKLRPCISDKDSQEWSWRKRGVIVSNGMCLTSDLMTMQGFVVVQFCKDDDNQIWYRHNEKIVHQDTNLCLDGHQGNTGLMITECIKHRTSQAWAISVEKTETAAEDNYLDPLAFI